MQHPLRILVGTAVFNSVVAGLLTIVGFGGTFAENLVFSQCIGFIVVLVFGAGWRMLSPRRRPSGGLLMALIGAAILAGWLGGSALGSALLSMPWSPGHSGGAVLAITAAASLVAMLYFWNRERTAELQRQAVEARLKLLQAQIEPHFLFNTLANLDALIQTDPGRARAMLGHLNDYLRATLLATRKEWSTLADEFALLSGYLEVQAIRMGPRLRHALELPAALAGATIPPMLLQPLVENAIMHGLEAKLEGGAIRVTAHEEGDAIVLAVADSGLGSSNAGGHGIGLDNVRERAAAVNGTLEFARNDAGGVTVTLRFPK